MDDETTTFPGTPVTIDVLSNDENKDGATICNVQSGSGGTAVISGTRSSTHRKLDSAARTHSLTRSAKQAAANPELPL
jgi:hypothetical protein